MYYKDKKLEINNFFKSEMSYLLNRSQNRRMFLLLIFLFLVYYFYSLSKSNDHHIIDQNDSIDSPYNRRHKKTSLLIDKMIEPSDDESNEDDAFPLHVLVTQYKNGIFLYNMEESVESWWPFECVKTRMQHSINTNLCIHDPKYDTHISAQLKANGLWEPVNVRSFLRQLNEVN